MPGAITLWGHLVDDRLPCCLLLVWGKVGCGDASQSCPRGVKAREVETEQLSLDTGLNPCVGELLKERCKIG